MRRCLAGISVFLLVTVNAAAQEIIESRITEVKLFCDRALVKRVAAGRVTKGINTINVGIDAFVIDSDSISAAVFGKGEVMSVQLKEEQLADMPQPDIKELEDKIRAAKEARDTIVYKKGILDKEEKFLDSITTFSGEQASKDIKTSFPKPDDLTAMMGFLEKNYAKVNADRILVDSKIVDADKEINMLERKLREIKGLSGKAKKVIEVVFNSETGQDITIEASYIAYNASWAPLYRVNAPPDLGSTSLIMFAVITQKTGEDWKDAKLVISNAVPFRGARIPIPDSWYLGAPERRMLKQSRMLLGSVMLSEKAGTAQGGAIEEEYAAPEAKVATAEALETPLSVEYTLPQSTTIESRDKEAILPLFSKDMRCEYFLYTAPRLNPATFLVGRASAERELLSGPMNVYLGGQFIGNAYLDTKKAGEFFDIPLGEDRQVITKEEKTADKITETFFGKVERLTVIREMAYKITVESLKDKKVTICVADAIPVSKTDKIVVKDLVMDPLPTEQNYLGKEGVMLWKFELGPGQTKEIKKQFTLTYPKGGVSGI